MSYIIDNLIKLADRLDEGGEYDAASEIDELIQKMAEEEPEKLEAVPFDKFEKDERSVNWEDFKEEGTKHLVEEVKYLVNKYVAKGGDKNILLDKIKSEIFENKADDQNSIDSVFATLTEMADKLDKNGARKQANKIDEFIQKYARYATDIKWRPEGDTEQSKRYDSKYHHEQQVRDPKGYHKNGPNEHHVKTYQPHEGTLSIRHCPQHIGVQLERVGEGIYRCPLDGEMINWELGWTDHEGKHRPGGSVAGQTPGATEYSIPSRIFDSREEVINRIN